MLHCSPYLWEAKKPIVLVNALEALMFLVVTIKVLVKIGLPAGMGHK